MTKPTRCDVDSGYAGLAKQYRHVTLERGEPVVQVCATCGTAFWPARLRCECGSATLQWMPSGTCGYAVSGVVVDTTAERAAEIGVPRRLVDRLPYTTVFVELADWPGVRIATIADGVASFADLDAPREVAISVRVSDGVPVLVTAS